MNDSYLDEIIDFGDDDFVCVEDEKKNKVIIIDGHNLAYKTVYSSIRQSPEENGEFKLWRHYMFNSFFNLLKTFNPDKVVFAFDEKGSWRYSIYPEYKSNRKTNKDKSVLNHEAFYLVMDDFMTSLKEVFSNVYVIKLRGAEADDIIAILSRELFKDEEVIIVSNDGDMNQLISKNIQQYDMSTQKMYECLNPKKQLELKILKGDTSDSIKGIKKGVGIKTAEKIMDMGFYEYIKTIEDDHDKEVTMANYKRNTMLINFDYIPTHVKLDILKIYYEYEIKDIEFKNVMKLFMRYELNKLLKEWNSISSLVKKLK